MAKRRTTLVMEWFSRSSLFSVSGYRSNLSAIVGRDKSAPVSEKAAKSRKKEKSGGSVCI